MASLVARYVLRREATGRLLLHALPAVDLVLIALTAIDLRAGSVATTAHGLAAVYVGFTVAFGPSVVRWADARFAHRFSNGPAPPPAPSGWRAVREDLALWLRCVVAWAIALAAIELLVALAGEGVRTEPLRAWYRIALGGVFFWFLFGPVWSLLVVARTRGR